MMDLDPSVITDHWTLLLQGAWLTLRITAIAFALGMIIGALRR